MTLPVNEIMVGDALQRLKGLPDECVQCCVTSPPYWGLRDYGVEGQIGLEPTSNAYVARLVEIFREVRRVLRADGTVWLNMGDSYCSAPAGNERPDNSGSDFSGTRGEQPKNRGRRQVGDKKHPEANIPAFGPNRSSLPRLKPKDMIGMPWRVAFALQADGWWLRSDIIWAKPNPMPESVTDRPTRSHEYVFLLAKSARYFYDAFAIREPIAESSVRRIGQETFLTHTGGPKDYANGTNPNRSARHALENFARYQRVPSGWNTAHEQSDLVGRFDNADSELVRRYRSGNKERKLEVPTRPNDHRGSSVPLEDNGTGRNRRSVWTVATHPFREAHFATFPEELIQPMILAGCPEGGVVLDPFIGAGTTALVALKAGRRFIGIELNPKYAKMAEERIWNEKHQGRLA